MEKVDRVTKDKQEKQLKKVLVTGASGLIGGLVLEGLGHKYEFSALNRRKVEAVPCHQADISDLEAILPAFEGIHSVVHLAAYTRGSWALAEMRPGLGGGRHSGGNPGDRSEKKTNAPRASPVAPAL